MRTGSHTEAVATYGTLPAVSGQRGREVSHQEVGARWPRDRRGRGISRSAWSTSRSRCSRRPTPARRSASTSCTASVRRASSRSAGARSASARCRTPTSSRASSSRRAATSSSTRRTSRRCASSRRASSTSRSSPTTPAIDPIYLERPYYLAPDGPVAREAFAVIREGMKGKAGIGKVALYGREYLVKVQPREQGLIMYTLRHANEIRSMDAIDELERHAGEGQAGGSEARQAGDGHVRGRASTCRHTATTTRSACARSSTPRSRAARSSRRRSRRRRRWST